MALLYAAVHFNCGRKKMRPNILFILTDDQKYNAIHALGNDEIITPNMDVLVRDGLTFRNACIMGGLSAAVCMPSRASLLTGRSVFRLKDSGREIPESHVTMPETFRKNGYVTFGTGKWHNGPSSYARSFSNGAKIFFGGMSTHWEIPMFDFDPAGQYDASDQYMSEGVHSSEVYANAAVDFLNDYEGEDPFFMYVAFQAPHDPREMPEKFRKLYDADRLSLPENFTPLHPFDNGELEVRDEKLASFPRSGEEVRRHIADYYGIITHLDEQIGRITKALRDNEYLENTIIVLAGDNGLALGEHGLMGKQNVYEHSVKVPLIMSGPGIPKGEESDTLCYLTDLYPTLCRLVNIEVPESCEGVAIGDVVRGTQPDSREALFFAYKNFQRAIRTDRYKLNLYQVKGEKRVQLFNLESDPKEMNDLSGDPGYAPLVQDLSRQLQTMLTNAGDGVKLDEKEWGVDEIPPW